MTRPRETEIHAHVVRADSNNIKATQSLISHLMSVAKLAAEIGAELDLFYTSFLLGALHDLGKISEPFQQRILGLSNRSVNHSSAGASFLLRRILDLREEIVDLDLIEGACYREILFYVITAHHGLYDTIGKGQNICGDFISRIDDRMAHNKDLDPDSKEVADFAQHSLEPATREELGLTIDSLVLKSLSELKNIALQIEDISAKGATGKEQNTKGKHRRIYEGFFVRLMLSILKTADCFDSSTWSLDAELSPLGPSELRALFREFHTSTEERAAKFADNKNSKPLNKARTHFSEIAQEHAKKQKNGISELMMPTGAGKTETGLRYAVTNIVEFNKNRMVYTAPFLSVVEQSARTIKNALGEENVLEHHSNIVNENENEHLDETQLDQSLYLPSEYIKDYWDAPVVVTTMVQFYNTLFAGKATNICRFCKLIDTTIILDEIQSLPVEHIYPFNMMLNFLAHIMKANILLCSATQPPFDHQTLRFPVLYSSNRHVIPDNKDLGLDAIDYNIFERSKVYPAWLHTDSSEDMGINDVVELLLEELEWANSALCILNTKVAVKLLFEEVKEKFPHAKVIYLTTNLCAAHRMEIVDEIREELRSNRHQSGLPERKIICITTSLIEAGVDVDFDLVLRSVTGADSIDQARGRCNREGILKNGGKVFIIRLKEDNTDNKWLKDIHNRGIITSNFANKQFNECRNNSLDMKLLTSSFYQKYFLENSEDMVMRLEDRRTSAIELLGTNQSALNAVGGVSERRFFKTKHLLLQSFRTASEAMRLIDDQTRSVIVPYQNDALLNTLMEALDSYDFKTVKRTLRSLQRYTISIPRWVKPDAHCSFVYEDKNINGLGIYILHEAYYDEICGAQIGEVSQEALLF